MVDVLLTNDEKHRNAKGEYAPSAFVSKIPVPAFVIFRCMQKWKVLESENGQVLLAYVPKAIDKFVTSNMTDNNLLSYWLGVSSVLFHLVGKEVGPSESTQISVILKDIEKMHIELPSSKAGDSVHKVALKFRDELELLTSKIYGILLRNVFNLLKPHAVAIVVPKEKKPPLKPGQLTPVKAIIELLTNLLACFQNNNLHSSISQQFFKHVLYHFNALIFNSIILRKELCSHKQGIQLKMELEAQMLPEVKKLSPEWIGKVEEYFKESRQLVRVLLTPLLIANDTQLRKEICPDLSLLQIKQLCTMYNTNCEEFETPVPVDVIASMLMDKDYNVDAPLLLDTADEYSVSTSQFHSVELKDITETKFPQEVLQSFIALARDMLKKDKAKKNAGIWSFFK
eukprot:TRINITY_DN11565_c0_g1_i1.p1 TRINITY_DN11565_c0_g1~~TRINITY_DN11565_c0_g1_i1.p1  ORF type:complete len:428 (-),score=75.28 TRINITY_DN11565_c0_g1_i1:50-1243(-)